MVRTSFSFYTSEFVRLDFLKRKEVVEITLFSQHLMKGDAIEKTVSRNI